MSTSPVLISVVIEGYNADIGLGSVADTLAGLRSQNFDLSKVEVILLTPGETQASAGFVAEEIGPFAALRCVSVPHAHYYELKNHGARLARGEIVALIDSDTCPDPGWMEAIAHGFSNGALIQSGITKFRRALSKTCSTPLASGSVVPIAAGDCDRWILLAAASISWGFIVPDLTAEGPQAARGFLSHNLAFRTSLLRELSFRADLGRTCAGTFLDHAIRSRGLDIRFEPRQCVEHNFHLSWWLTKLHVRFGHEVHRLKRIDPDAAHAWIRWLGPLEPFATMLWHVMLDLPQWRRTCRAREVGRARALCLIPALFLLSVSARFAEMVGMYASMLRPQVMQKFAARN